MAELEASDEGLILFERCCSLRFRLNNLRGGDLDTHRLSRVDALHDFSYLFNDPTFSPSPPSLGILRRNRNRLVFTFKPLCLVFLPFKFLPRLRFFLPDFAPSIFSPQLLDIASVDKRFFDFVACWLKRLKAFPARGLFDFALSSALFWASFEKSTSLFTPLLFLCLLLRCGKCDCDDENIFRFAVGAAGVE